MVPWICVYYVLLPVALFRTVLSQGSDVRDEYPQVYVGTLRSKKFLLMPIDNYGTQAMQDVRNNQKVKKKSKDSTSGVSDRRTLLNLNTIDTNLLGSSILKQERYDGRVNKQTPGINSVDPLTVELRDENLRQMVSLMRILDKTLPDNLGKNSRKCIRRGRHVSILVPCSILNLQNTKKHTGNEIFQQGVVNSANIQETAGLHLQNLNSYKSYEAKPQRNSHEKPLNAHVNLSMKLNRTSRDRLRYVNALKNVNVGSRLPETSFPNIPVNPGRLPNVNDARGNLIETHQENPPGSSIDTTYNPPQRVINDRVDSNENSLLLADGSSVDLPTLLRKLYTQSIHRSQGQIVNTPEHDDTQKSNSNALVLSDALLVDLPALLRKIYTQSIQSSETSHDVNVNEQTLKADENSALLSDESSVGASALLHKIAQSGSSRGPLNEIGKPPENKDKPKITGNVLLLPDGSSIDVSDFLELIYNHIIKNGQTAKIRDVLGFSGVKGIKDVESTLVPVATLDNHIARNPPPVISKEGRHINQKEHSFSDSIKVLAESDHKSGSTHPNSVEDVEDDLVVTRNETVTSTEVKCDPNVAVNLLVNRFHELLNGKTISVNVGLNTNLAEILLLMVNKISADASLAHVVSNIDNIIKTSNVSSGQNIDLKLEFKVGSPERVNVSPGVSEPLSVNHTSESWSKTGVDTLESDHEVLNDLIFKEGVDSLPSRVNETSEMFNKDAPKKPDESTESAKKSTTEKATPAAASDKPGNISTTLAPDLEIGNRIISYEEDLKPETILGTKDSAKAANKPVQL